jgi:hypothetical protein
MRGWKRARMMRGVSGAGGPTGALGAAAFAVMDTTFTDDLSPDGMTWDAVGGAFIVDAFGKYIQYIQRYNGNTRLCYFVYSNDKGVTWTDNTGVVGGEGFLVRGDIEYDAARDCIHGLVVTTNAGDGGIIYRRYTIARDGSNNITSIARAAPTESLDSDGDAYEFPTLIMSDANTLLASWTVRNVLGGEIRAVKCDISGDDNAGGTDSNWVHIGVSSTTLLVGSTPHTASYTIVYTQALANVFTYFSIKQLASGDLGWFYHSGSTPGQWRWRRSVRNAANTWNSLSDPVVVSEMQVAGTDTGYELKVQLATKVVEDASGNAFCVAPVWLSNASGDAVRLFAISAADAVSAATVYSASGAHSYAPTCGLAWDSVSGRLVVTYIKTTTSFTYLQAFSNALASLQSELAVETTTICDIPLIVFARDNGKLGVAFRRQGSPPQPGRFGLITWG